MPPKSVPPPIPTNAPPPPERSDSGADAAESAGMAAVMQELLTGEVNLRKVTDDMKTKNQKGEIVKASAPSDGSQIVGKVVAPQSLASPVCEIQRSNWVVENYVNHQGVLKLEECTMKQVVYVSKCVNSTIHVGSKVKSVTLDGCKKLNLIVHSVISSVELVNCERVKVISLHELPSISIDKCSGVSVTLSVSSLDCTFTTSKSSEMNVLIPIGNPEDGDYKEIPIPEQFVHTLRGNRIVTEVSGLYQ
jgi:adenylyl cyclase-associated protein